MKPEIIFEDAHLIVLSKPAGLLSQSDISGEESLVDWLRQYFGRHYVGLIHRLDRNTSGIMIVAKRTKAARRLTESLQSGEMERVYRAWVWGNLVKKEMWEDQLLKDTVKNKMKVVSKKNKKSVKDFQIVMPDLIRHPVHGSRVGARDDRAISEGKKWNVKTQEARLCAEPLRHGFLGAHAVTLIAFKLDTGRSHQIRIQAAERGYPLIGDSKYGTFSLPVSGFQRIISRPALHSWRLSVPHPMSGERLQFEAACPKDWVRLEQEIKARS